MVTKSFCDRCGKEGGIAPVVWGGSYGTNYSEDIFGVFKRKELCSGCIAELSIKIKKWASKKRGRFKFAKGRV